MLKDRTRKNLNAFPYYGGKFMHLNFILPKLPYTNAYVEPFGGSASVLLNRHPSPIEVYNDLYDDVVIFFKVLRENTDELLRKLFLTPYSKTEFIMAKKAIEDEDFRRTLSNEEIARYFYIRMRQSFNSGGRSWSRVNYFMVRRDTSIAVSRWLTGIKDLDNIAKRMLSVIMENDDALKVIERYDSPQTLFYVDPPYPSESRISKSVYMHEADNEFHEKLAELLDSIEGLAAVSGYECDLMDRLYKGWRKFVDKEKKLPSSFVKNKEKDEKEKRIMREVLWTNYDPKKVASSTSNIKKYL